MPWNLLISPLAGGYLILSRLNYFRFKQQRLDRQRLIFDSILIAIALISVTFLLKTILFILFDGLQNFCYDHLPIRMQYFGTSITSFFLAVLIVLIGNKTFFSDRQKEINKSIIKVGNEFELLLRDSMEKKSLVEITLDSKKVYIGWVKELPIPLVSNYLRIIPALSGYRNETHHIIFTTDYLTVYSTYIESGSSLNAKELNVDLIITIDNIVSISYFDHDMWEKFNPQKKEQKSPSKSTQKSGAPKKPLRFVKK
jgi:hypothetical protein